MSTNAAAIKFAQVGNKIPNFDYTPCLDIPAPSFIIDYFPFCVQRHLFFKKKALLEETIHKIQPTWDWPHQLPNTHWPRKTWRQHQIPLGVWVAVRLARSCLPLVTGSISQWRRILKLTLAFTLTQTVLGVRNKNWDNHITSGVQSPYYDRLWTYMITKTAWHGL